MTPFRAPFIRLALIAFATLSCDPGEVSIATPTVDGAETASAAHAAGVPVGNFRTTPPADSSQAIHVAPGDVVTVSGARFVPANPDDELKVEVEWGDGQRSANGCGPCRVDHRYAAGTFELVATVHDRRFVDRGSVQQTFIVIVGTPAVDPAAPTSTPAPLCHAISNYAGAACPTGATQFCDSSPIDANSSAQAQAACNACLGVSCVLATPCGAGVLGWEHPTGTPSSWFVFSSTSPGVLAGSINGGTHNFTVCGGTARWAP